MSALQLTSVMSVIVQNTVGRRLCVQIALIDCLRENVRCFAVRVLTETALYSDKFHEIPGIPFESDVNVIWD